VPRKSTSSKPCPEFLRYVRGLHKNYTKAFEAGVLTSRGEVIDALCGKLCLTQSQVYKLLSAVKVADEIRPFVKQKYGASPEKLIHPSFLDQIGRLRSPEARRQFAAYVIEKKPTFPVVFRAAQMMSRKKKPIEDVEAAFDVAERRVETASSYVRLVLTFYPEDWSKLEERAREWGKRTVKDYVYMLIANDIRAGSVRLD